MKKLELGLVVSVRDDVLKLMEEVLAFGLPTCQLICHAESAEERLAPKRVKEAIGATGVRVTAMFFNYDGQIYNNVDGPRTIGWVPAETRARRIELAKRFADIAAEIGVSNLPTHLGFVPNDERDPAYGPLIEAMRGFCEYIKKQGQNLLLETGPELPSTLRRTIRDVGTGNVFINFDWGNGYQYGTCNPLDTLDILGDYIRGVHAKDGLPPNRGEPLGPELPLGEGAVDYPLVLRRLKERGYDGPISIENKMRPRVSRKDEILHAIKELTPHL